MKNCNVIIVGGGVIGISIAYHLASAGTKKVAVFERFSIGQANTSRAAGLLTEVGPNPALTPYVLQTYADIDQIEKSLGRKIGLHQADSLHLGGTNTTQKILARYAHIGNEHERNLETLNNE